MRKWNYDIVNIFDAKLIHVLEASICNHNSQKSMQCFSKINTPTPREDFRYFAYFILQGILLEAELFPEEKQWFGDRIHDTHTTGSGGIL